MQYSFTNDVTGPNGLYLARVSVSYDCTTIDGVPGLDGGFCWCDAVGKDCIKDRKKGCSEKEMDVFRKLSCSGQVTGESFDSYASCMAKCETVCKKQFNDLNKIAESYLGG